MCSLLLQFFPENNIRSIGSDLKKSGSAKFSVSILGNEINLDEGSGVYEERLVKINTVQENTGFGYENVNQY